MAQGIFDVQDLLFWVVVLGVMVWLGRRRRPAPGREAPETIQSYRIMEGGALLLSKLAAHPSLRWRVLSLEELPTQHRRRMILHIAVDEPLPAVAALERLLWSLASGLQRRARAHVVVVEAFSASRLPPTAGAGALRLLLSLDGHGWSGQAPVIACLEGDAAPLRTFSLGQVHRMLAPASTPQPELADAGGEGRGEGSGEGGTLDGPTAPS